MVRSNGIRVALVGSGIAVTHEQTMLWVAGAVAAAGITYAALHILGAV